VGCERGSPDTNRARALAEGRSGPCSVSGLSVVRHVCASASDDRQTSFTRLCLLCRQKFGEVADKVAGARGRRRRRPCRKKSSGRLGRGAGLCMVRARRRGAQIGHGCGQKDAVHNPGRPRGERARKTKPNARADGRVEKEGLPWRNRAEHGAGIAGIAEGEQRTEEGEIANELATSKERCDGTRGRRWAPEAAGAGG
jgi:hypothetical protein